MRGKSWPQRTRRLRRWAARMERPTLLMEPRFVIQNFNSLIFYPIFNITIICPVFNTSIFGKYHHFDILQISHPLMCSCFIPRSPLRLPTTLRTTRTRPSAAGRSGNYSRNISQEYENIHQRSRRRGGACLVWDLWPRQGGHPQGGRQATFNPNSFPQRKVKGEKLSKLSGTFAEGWGETIPASKKKRTLAFQFRSNKKNTAGGFRCQVTVSCKKKQTEISTKKVTKVANKKNLQKSHKNCKEKKSLKKVTKVAILSSVGCHSGSWVRRGWIGIRSWDGNWTFWRSLPGFLFLYVLFAPDNLLP